jgi:dCTP deaminase
MSVLTRAEILKAIEKNEIKISPFDPAAVGPASVDLSLSNEFRRFQPSDKVIRVTNDIDFKDHTTKVVLKEGEEFLLKPGELVLGITREQIGLSSQICGLLEGRSRFARMGVYVHVSCCFMNPGIDNRQVLEIYNCSQVRQ